MLVFDLDNTITPSREQISPEMASLFYRICRSNHVAITTGAHIGNVKRQLGACSEYVNEIYTNYCEEWYLEQRNLKFLDRDVLKYFSGYGYSLISHKLTLTTVSSISERQQLVRQFKLDFSELNFFVSGRRSIDVLPSGVTKHSAFKDIPDIIYFGDEFYEFGNDTTVVASEVHRVDNWQHTKQILERLIDEGKVNFN